MKLICGNCLEIMKYIPDKYIDLVVTDPPYELREFEAGAKNPIRGMQESVRQLVDNNIHNGYDIINFGDMIIPKMKTINIYFWCNKKQIPKYFDYWVNQHKCMFDIICWHKHNAMPTYSNKYLTDTEYCLYFHKSGVCFPQTYEDAKTYVIQGINYTDKKLYKHPTIKPLDIIEKLIRNSSKENGIILDPFMGSGTTGVACKRNRRNFIGIEINKEYYNIARNRIENETVMR